MRLLERWTRRDGQVFHSTKFALPSTDGPNALKKFGGEISAENKSSSGTVLE